MKLRAASRSSSFSNAAFKSGVDPNMCRNDHSVKRLPRPLSCEARVSFAPQSQTFEDALAKAESGQYLFGCAQTTISGNDKASAPSYEGRRTNEDRKLLTTLRKSEAAA